MEVLPYRGASLEPGGLGRRQPGVELNLHELGRRGHSMLIVSEGFRPGELSSRALFPPQPRDYQPDFVVRNLRRQRFFQWFEPLQSQAGTRRLDHSTPRFLYPVRLERSEERRV